MMAQELSQELVGKFVGVAHGDLDTVKRLYEQEPALLNARYETWNETALEAASHMGNRPIAEYLLEQGAPLVICTAAMLGRTEDVARFLQEDPDLSTARGAHGITVLYHAAMSGETEIADLLVAHGGGEGASHALHGAVAFGRTDMVRWLLERGVDNVNMLDFMGKTPLAVALEKGHNEIAEMLRQYGGLEEMVAIA
jgi:ankyrin repeat protein